MTLLLNALHSCAHGRVCPRVLVFCSVLLDYLAYSLVPGSAYLAGLTTFIRSLFSPISHTSLVFCFVLVFKYSTFLLHTVTLVSLVMYQSVGKIPHCFLCTTHAMHLSLIIMEFYQNISIWVFIPFYIYLCI